MLQQSYEVKDKAVKMKAVFEEISNDRAKVRSETMVIHRQFKKYLVWLYNLQGSLVTFQKHLMIVA